MTVFKHVESSCALETKVNESSSSELTLLQASLD